ncbi:aMP-binding enzyme [Firmicutes bacterium CAG:321]|nr:aMP-binding enzyme [Firmicutes bacterium CAG:321]
MELLKRIEELKREIQNNPSDSFDIILNNIPKYTMYGYVRECNKNNLDRYALRFGRKRYTYGEFIDLIDRYAKGFAAMGIRKGDRVALLLPNLPESTIIIYALNKIGAISDNIDPTSKEDRMKYFLEKEKVNAIVCFDKVYETSIKSIENYIYNELNIDKVLITKITDSLPMIESAMYRMKFRDEDIVKRVSTSYGNINIFGINRFLNDSRYQVCYTNPYVENEVATICHSSGTTGVPKTIPSTNENVNFIAFQHQVSNIDYSRVKTFLHVLPGFAQFGFSDSMHLGHSLGLEMIEIPIFSQENIIDILLKTKANCLFGTPSFWLRLIGSDKYNNADLSFLEEAVYGGGTLTITQLANINRFLISHNAKCLLRTGYGMSEFNGTCILEDPFMSTPGSCGIDLPGGSGIIINPDTMNELSCGELGHLYYSKGSNPVCEFDGEVLHKTINIDGREYIDTGDIMKKNARGEYFFEGRASGMISRYDGYKIYPNALENAVTSSSYVEDVMISEYYDESNFGAMPLIYVVLSKESKGIDIKDIIKNIIDNYILSNNNMSFRDIPTKWKVVDELPYTTALKKDYKKIKENGIDGSEISIVCHETNMGLGYYDIVMPTKGKKLIKK